MAARLRVADSSAAAAQIGRRLPHIARAHLRYAQVRSSGDHCFDWSERKCESEIEIEIEIEIEKETQCDRLSRYFISRAQSPRRPSAEAAIVSNYRLTADVLYAAYLSASIT